MDGKFTQDHNISVVENSKTEFSIYLLRPNWSDPSRTSRKEILHPPQLEKVQKIGKETFQKDLCYDPFGSWISFLQHPKCVVQFSWNDKNVGLVI